MPLLNYLVHIHIGYFFVEAIVIVLSSGRSGAEANIKIQRTGG
jgi:hypothetical protein